MDLGLDGRTALVFGGSKGLGRAGAEALIAEGARVAIVARDAERTRAAAKEIGAVALPGDVSRPGQGAELVEAAARALGASPDILITNTGGPPKGAFETMTSAQWSASFDNLFLGAIESIRAALPAMRERRWGRIIALTSVAAKEPQPGLILSSSLRAGLLGLVNGLSREVAGAGITINALLPGYIKTDRLTELGLDEAAVSRTIPAGRLGTPAEFAAVAAFLASERAAYVNGQAIAVDGALMNGI